MLRHWEVAPADGPLYLFRRPKHMGNFYTNYTLRGPSQQAVAKALAGRSAIVTSQRLPPFAVGGGFSYVSDGEIPEGLSEEDLLRVT